MWPSRASSGRRRRARGGELAPARRDHEAAERRPAAPRGRRRGVRWSVLRGDPDAGVGRDEQAPARGSEKSAGCARSTPTTSCRSPSTARPGGEASAAARAAPASATAIGHRRRSRDTGALLERRRDDAPCPVARRLRVRDLEPPSAPPSQTVPHRVEAAPQPRVDRSARQLEESRDLSRRVVEEVAEHDHRVAPAAARPARPARYRSVAAGSVGAATVSSR